jgi:hypothetical protein
VSTSCWSDLLAAIAHLIVRQVCPPGGACWNPIREAGGIWPIVATIAGAVIGLAVTLAFVLRPRDGQPAFVPDAPGLWLAGGLAGLGTILFAGWLQSLAPILWWLGAPAAIAALPIAGVSLRPRGSRFRGLLLGVSAYVLTGVVTLVILNALLGSSIRDLVLEPVTLLLALNWPGLIASYLGGYLGR